MNTGNNKAEFEVFSGESDIFTVYVYIRNCTSVGYNFKFSNNTLDEERIGIIREKHSLSKVEEKELRELISKTKESRK